MTTLIFTDRVPTPAHRKPDHILPLTATERTRSRYRFTTLTGQAVLLQLPRGTVLQGGDWLQTSAGEYLLRIEAVAEPVLTVQAHSELDLLRAAYHLGNRHVALEITPTYLRLSPDPVLKDLLLQLGMLVLEEVHPFFPESGAYGHSH